jgi:hypothetical protein
LQPQPSPESLPPSNNVQTIPTVPSHEELPASRSPDRPPPLKEQRGCEVWYGTFSGNDPTVLVEARLCNDSQGAVGGVVQWSSLRSGYNIREVSGMRDAAGRLMLHDTQFMVNRPMNGWQFCLIDSYVLAPQGGGEIIGSYESVACNDYASVDLHRSP